IRVARHRA
ncbi:hypothetical protein D039_1581B, partial [Vibrio parahaemolyticus EKP-028]